MAEVEKMKKAVVVTCDCGLKHKVTRTDSGEYEIETFYSKKKEPEKKEPEKPKDDFLE